MAVVVYIIKLADGQLIIKALGADNNLRNLTVEIDMITKSRDKDKFNMAHAKKAGSFGSEIHCYLKRSWN